MTHAWAVGRVKGAEYPIIEVWTAEKIWKHRDKFNRVGKRHYSYAHKEMYARKVVVLQVLKYLPKSPELATAINLENAAETGGQKLNLKDAVEGIYTAPDPEPEQPAEPPAVAAPEETKPS
jgi:recombination protein RecT